MNMESPTRISAGGINERGLVFAAVICCLILFPASAFLACSQEKDPDAGRRKAHHESPTFFIKGFEHTAVEDGKIIWRIYADSASLAQDGSTVRLENIEAYFYQKNASPVRVTASHGEANLITKHSVLSGDVNLFIDEYLLNTQGLQYNGESHILKSKAKVILKGKGEILKADSATFDLAKNIIILEGNVSGTILLNDKQKPHDE